jgi:hypothetical protein
MIPSAYSNVLFFQEHRLNHRIDISYPFFFLFVFAYYARVYSNLCYLIRRPTVSLMK